MGNTLTLKHTSKKVVFVVFLFVILLLLQLISNMKPEVKLGMATWNLWGNVTFDANLNQGAIHKLRYAFFRVFLGGGVCLNVT